MPAAEPTIDAGTLYREHAPSVVRFVLRLGVAAHDLDDVVQEIFMTAHRRGGYRPGPMRPTTWLASLALEVVRALRGRHRRLGEVVDAEVALDKVAATAPTPLDRAEHAEALWHAEQALARLSLEHRAVFVLYDLEGEGCDAIAATLGVPVGTVYSRLHTARRQLLEAWRRVGALRQSLVAQVSR